MRIYLRIGKKNRGYKVEASSKPDYHPVKSGSQAYPTVAFAIDIDIPDPAFEEHERSVGRIVVPEDRLRDIGIELA